jgi:NAD(P)-dependent dehydrogenase (short-subunit alcohol dehydrogenase family)
LGASVTNAFLDAGASVVGVSRSIEHSEFPNPRFTALAANITSLESAKAISGAVIAKLGRIDVAVHLVGGFAGGLPVADTDDATLDKMMALNFQAAFHLVRAVLPAMRAQGAGSILAIGSRAVIEQHSGIGAYAASKAALAALIRTVALENKDRGISANLILPSTIDTPANRAASPGADHTKWVQPSQIAALLVHLASGQASQISGAQIPIFGGEL